MEVWVVIQELSADMDMRILYIGNSKEVADSIAYENECEEDEVYCYVRQYKQKKEEKDYVKILESLPEKRV